MLGTIDLYNLALTPNDTMYFDSTETQTEWFNNQEHLSIDDISFNGARAFQLGKNYLDVIFNYNYVRYKLNDRYIYAFIENVDYTNDNCCVLNISIDLNQTFLNELQTAIVKSNISNSTEKNSFFNTYKPYSNKLNVSSYNVTNLGQISYNAIIKNKNYCVGFILINTELPDNIKLFSLKDNSTTLKSFLFTSEADFTYPFSTIIIPVLYNISNQTFESATKIYFNDTTNDNVQLWESSSLETIIQELGSYIVNSNVGFVISKFTFIKDVTVASNNNVYININSEIEAQNDIDYVTVGEKNCNCIFIINNRNKRYRQPFYKDDISLPLFNIPKALQRSPYCFIRVGCDTNFVDINLLDFFYTNETNTGNTFSYIFLTSVLYPFTTSIKFYYNNKPINDPNLYFNINSSSPLPFSISAWQDYYSTHSASVNDGLATQQKYERKQDQLQLTKGLVSGAIDIATSFVPFTKAGNLKKIAGASDKQIMGGVLGGGQTILNAGLDYANSELEREKQRALLEIDWNDIKSSPSEFSNAMTNFTNLLYNNGQIIEINLYIAMNIEDIKNYHKQYGYQINRMQSLPWNTIKKHTVFDYISFNEITIKSSLPQFYTAMIEQQFEQGVRFWYDYNNFMNFDIPNEEIAGGSQ